MQIAFLLYDGMTALDFVGPHEILCRLPGATVKRVARRAGPVSTDSAGLKLMAECSLSDVSEATVLLIPGAGNAATLRNRPDMLAWVQAIHKTTLWTTSVCTGSLILGAAGLLEDKRATTHWAAMDRLSFFGATPVRERIVEDGNIMSAAGVSAGIDLALVLATKLCGPQVAQSLQLGIEYDPDPPFDVGSPEKASPALLQALRSRFDVSFEKNY